MSVLINLRQAIVQKVASKSDAEIVDMIEGSIDHDERALPGLGVLFEMIWKESDDGQRNQFIQTLQHKLNEGQQPT
ncbi:small acid-soluble spore protein SspI [Paenibacillus sp. 481]|uniref:small acid-soluble spore protein SspI n=1 Tax=Paenibacillus sp. 481 TaxID=2835869 RepID=UPI001E5C5FE3|nr:small acid-soluble spore protein SspI [Paenibacillus sp. 481]UHA71858.1 small acid-soluble spore protein SspI [Paenibacillus sp. 481]